MGLGVHVHGRSRVHAGAPPNILPTHTHPPAPPPLHLVASACPILAEFPCCSSVALERPNENTFTHTLHPPVVVEHLGTLGRHAGLAVVLEHKRLVVVEEVGQGGARGVV